MKPGSYECDIRSWLIRSKFVDMTGVVAKLKGSINSDWSASIRCCFQFFIHWIIERVLAKACMEIISAAPKRSRQACMKSWPAREEGSYQCKINSIERSERQKRYLGKQRRWAKVRTIEEGVGWSALALGSPAEPRYYLFTLLTLPYLLEESRPEV